MRMSDAVPSKQSIFGTEHSRIELSGIEHSATLGGQAPSSYIPRRTTTLGASMVGASMVGTRVVSSRATQHSADFHPIAYTRAVCALHSPRSVHARCVSCLHVRPRADSVRSAGTLVISVAFLCSRHVEARASHTRSSRSRSTDERLALAAPLGVGKLLRGSLGSVLMRRRHRRRCSSRVRASRRCAWTRRSRRGHSHCRPQSKPAPRDMRRDRDTPVSRRRCKADRREAMARGRRLPLTPHQRPLSLSGLAQRRRGLRTRPPSVQPISSVDSAVRCSLVPARTSHEAARRARR
jgi:hypothetical protein